MGIRVKSTSHEVEAMPTLPHSGESTPPLEEKDKSGPTTLVSVNSVAGDSNPHLIKQFSCTWHPLLRL